MDRWWPCIFYVDVKNGKERGKGGHDKNLCIFSFDLEYVKVFRKRILLFNISIGV